MLTAGENGLVVEFGSSICPETNYYVQQFNRLLAANPFDGMIETVPTYRSVTIYFNPLIVARTTVCRHAKQLLTKINPQDLEHLSTKLVHVPVCYGGVLGPDLEYVARFSGLSSPEVVTLHTSKPFLVYMLGFIPGFPYLGGLPEALAVPRQSQPRAKVPAGSVGIGGNQTGFYPLESQGEWWLIGRTPLQAFNPHQDNPFLVAAGDYVQFFAIDIDEYFKIRRQIAGGTFTPDVRPLQGEWYK